MVARTFKHVMHIVGGLAAGLVILLAFAAWHLSSGPISVGFLTVYIERALNASARGVSVTLDDTVLTWAGWDRTLDIRAIGLRILSPNGDVVAAVPELSLSLSARALVNGKFAPRRIELFRPRIRFVRSSVRGLMLGFEDGQAGSSVVFQRALDDLLAPEDGGTDGLKYLNRLTINDAAVTLVDEDLGTAWQAPGAQIKLTRSPDGIHGDVDLNLTVNDGKNTRVTLAGDYRSASRTIDAVVGFSELVPMEMSGLSQKVGMLSAISMPLDGTISMTIGLDGKVSGVGFKVVGDAGPVTVPGPFGQVVALKGAAIDGRYDNGAVIVDTLHIDFGDDGKIELPGTEGHTIPVRNATFSATYETANDRLQIFDAVADLGGPLFSISATIEGVSGPKTSVEARASLQDVPTDRLEQYWPAAWGSNPHRWVMTHLSKGRVIEARAEVKLTTDAAGKLADFKISGELDAEGVTVDYLAPMPKIVDTAAKATFDNSKFHLKSYAGRIFGLRLADADVRLYDLDTAIEKADIAFTVEGSLPDAMRLIDSKPLEFVSSLGLDPAKTRGNSRANVKLRFPLEKNLTLEKVGVAAAAALSEVEIVGLKPDIGLNQGRFELRADKEKLTVSGTGELHSIPAKIEWVENFRPKTPFRSRYSVTVNTDLARLVRDFDLQFEPFTGGYMEGGVAGEIAFTSDWRRRGTLDVRADLKNTRLAIPPLKWEKAAGVPATTHVVLNTENDVVTRVSKLAINAADLAFAGTATVAEGKRLDRLDIDRFLISETDVRGSVARNRDGGWIANISGPVLDIEPLFESFAGAKKDANEPEISAPLTMIVDVDRLRLGPKRFLSGVKANLVRDRGEWRRATVDGLLPSEASILVRISPADGGTRRLKVQTTDGGSLLRALGYYEYMKGGALQLDGIYNDNIASSPLNGTLRIRDYRIIKAPGLAKLLSILSLTGIFDALQGEGVGFNNLSVPYTYDGDVLEITDAKANGVSLGYTANGRIFMESDQVDIEGTLVPAYMINSALGRIPLIGGLFTGEEGGGVFAATFRMKGSIEDPDITVNPLSALAPGFLRGLFGAFDRPSEVAPPRAADPNKPANGQKAPPAVPNGG